MCVCCRVRGTNKITCHSEVNMLGAVTITVSLYWAWRRLKSKASRLFVQLFVQAKSEKTSKLLITGLCAKNSAVTGELQCLAFCKGNSVDANALILFEKFCSNGAKMCIVNIEHDICNHKLSTLS